MSWMMHIGLIYYANDANTETNGLRKCCERIPKYCLADAVLYTFLFFSPQVTHLAPNTAIYSTSHIFHKQNIQCMWIMCVFVIVENFFIVDPLVFFFYSAPSDSAVHSTFCVSSFCFWFLLFFENSLNFRRGRVQCS